MALCCQLARLKWGLQPRQALWFYTSMVRLIITCACIVWYKKTQQRTRINALNKVQRLACLLTTGAVSSTPTAALEAMLYLDALHVHTLIKARVVVLRAAAEEKIGTPVK